VGLHDDEQKATTGRDWCIQVTRACASDGCTKDKRVRPRTKALVTMPSNCGACMTPLGHNLAHERVYGQRSIDRPIDI